MDDHDEFSTDSPEWDLAPEFAISEPQADFLDDTRNRHPGFVSGLGGGKTFAGLFKALDLTLVNRGLPMLLMEPTYTMIERIMWPTLFNEILDRRGIPYEFNKTAKILKFPWGSEFWFNTAENPRRIVGLEVASAYGDEVGLMPKLAWSNICSRVRAPRANLHQAFATFTPENPGWTHDNWGRRELYDEPLPEGYAIYQGATADNWKLPDNYEGSLLDEWDEDDAQARVYGKFASTKKGRVYYTFDIKQNVKSEAKYDPALPLGFSFDFNQSPGMHVEVVQVRRDKNKLYVVDEVYSRNLTLEAACKKILIKYASRQQSPITVYGDANGRHLASRKSYYTIIRDIFKNGMEGQAGFRRGEISLAIRVKVPSKNPPLPDSIASTRAALCSAQQVRRLIINPACKRLINDFYNVKTSASAAEEMGRGFRGNPDDIFKGDASLTHASDAIRYWIWQVSPIRDRFKRQIDYHRKALKRSTVHV